jgi:hypothetical protein
MFKKFEFYYSSPFGPTYSLVLKNNKWYYETDNEYEIVDILIDMEPFISAMKNDEIITHIDSRPAEVNPSSHRLKRLHSYLKQYCKHWEKDYAWMKYCDGDIWECEIEGEDFTMKSRGHVEAPGNFETLLHKLTIFTEGKYFGPGIY